MVSVVNNEKPDIDYSVIWQPSPDKRYPRSWDPPFWYKRPERKWSASSNPWYGNKEDYVGGSIFDMHLIKTLQSANKGDVVELVGMDTEGIVPGFSLRKLDITEDSSPREQWVKEIKVGITKRAAEMNKAHATKLKCSSPSHEEHSAATKRPDCVRKLRQLKESNMLSLKSAKLKKYEEPNSYNLNNVRFNIITPESHVTLPINIGTYGSTMGYPVGSGLQQRNYEGYWRAPVPAAPCFRKSLTEFHPLFPYPRVS